MRTIGGPSRCAASCRSCFGITALAAPVATMLALVLVFGAYSFVDGCFTIVLALRQALAPRERWGLLLLNGLFGILAWYRGGGVAGHDGARLRHADREVGRSSRAV